MHADSDSTHNFAQNLNQCPGAGSSACVPSLSNIYRLTPTTVIPNYGGFFCGVSFTATSCSACTAQSQQCRSIQAAVDGNISTDWNPAGGGISYSIEFEYPTCVEPQQFVVLPHDSAHDRSQWTIQAGNMSGQYTFSLPAFNTAITGAQKTFSFYSSSVCARC